MSCVRAHGEWGRVQPDHLKHPGRAPLRTVDVGAGRFACYECVICREGFWVREDISGAEVKP